jgi:hypothetical protein
MTKFEQLIKQGIEEIDAQMERAYQILGAKPGPGIDIEIHPDYPITQRYRLIGLTKAGKAFISKFWIDPIVQSNHQLGEFKRQANDWQLTYRVAVKFEPL